MDTPTSQNESSTAAGKTELAGSIDSAGTVAPVEEQLTGGAIAPEARNRIVPDAVTKRFLRIDDKYYFPDRTLAFVDTGGKLKVRTNNLEVVHSVVAIIQARGWQTVQVKGTQEFRQRLWHEATLQGIGVLGYEPSPLEMQQLQRALDRDQSVHQARGQGRKSEQEEEKGQPRTHEKDPSQTATSSTAGLVKEEHKRTAPRNGLRAPMVGTLLAHAAAPYQFDPMQRMSYYVRIQTEVGERTVWGTDLERALAESQSNVRVGDEVVLTQRGAKPVTVRVPDRDADGVLVGDKKLVAQRTVWRVESVPHLEALERKAELFRRDAVDPVSMLTQHPEMAGAIAGMKLAEQFAQQLTSQPGDQVRVMQAIRNRLADALSQGQQIELPERQPRQVQPHHRGRQAPTREDPEHART